MIMDINQNNDEALDLWLCANEQASSDERTAEESAAGIATACTCAEEDR